MNNVPHTKTATYTQSSTWRTHLIKYTNKLNMPSLATRQHVLTLV